MMFATQLPLEFDWWLPGPPHTSHDMFTGHMSLCCHPLSAISVRQDYNVCSSHNWSMVPCVAGSSALSVYQAPRMYKVPTETRPSRQIQTTPSYWIERHKSFQRSEGGPVLSIVRELPQQQPPHPWAAGLLQGSGCPYSSPSFLSSSSPLVGRP